MTVVQMETFAKVAELKSFSAAADALGYAQSTVTTQIRQLEEELNCLLFERLGKRTVLTREGSRLVPYAEKMLSLMKEIPAGIVSPDEPVGMLRIGVSESLCYHRIPGLLLRYKEQNPKVDLRISFVEHRTFPEQLKQGVLDMVYTLNPLIESPGLKLLHKTKESLGFFAAPDFPVKTRKSLTEADLADMPLLLTGHQCSFRAMLLAALEKENIRPNIILETSSKSILKQFAVNRFGIAFIPDMIAEEEVRRKMLKKLPWAGAEFPVFAQVFVHKDKHVNAAMQSMLEILSTDQRI